jgi:hypothetical protein
MATKKKAAPKKAAKKPAVRKPRVKKSLAEKYAKLFPVTKNITKTLIKNGTKHLWDSSRCIGALTLHAVLGKGLTKDLKVPQIWGCEKGILSFIDGSELTLRTENGVDVMDITEPTTVTFVVTD